MSLLDKMKGLLFSEQQECRPRRPGRNDGCWCGSGRKYKKCHLKEDDRKLRAGTAVACGKT